MSAVLSCECPGEDLDLRGADQRDPYQLGVIVVVLQEVLSMVTCTTCVSVSNHTSSLVLRLMAMTTAVLTGAAATLTGSRKHPR
jgi:hypothetical protein